MHEYIFNQIKLGACRDMKTLVELALKTSEETGELAEAVLWQARAPGALYKNKTREDILEEAVDVMICALATACRAIPELTHHQVLDVFDRKIEKWERVAQNIPPKSVVE